VLLTPHQAFFTEQALADIARETAKNLDDFNAGRHNPNFV
jgi:lactate dehydrogenase-like 2-hydroxyacid dehydrogenase